MIAAVLTITIIVNLSFVWCKHDLIHWDECTDLLVELQNCTSKFHLPSDCEGDIKSELLQCGETVFEKVEQCTDEIGVRMIKYFVETFRHSDKILCKENMHSEFAQNKQCTKYAKKIAAQMASTIPGALSEKGCTVFKNSMYIYGLEMDETCYSVLKHYIDALYEESSCSHVPIDAPSYENLQDLRITVTHLVACWVVYEDMFACKTTLSKRMECLNAVNTTGHNDAFTQLSKNFLEVSEKTDEVMCSSSHLRQDFKNNNDCWTHVKTIGLLILGQANGLLTKDGCQAVKYTENIAMAAFEENCVKILQDYREAMDTALPCHEAPAAPS